MFVCNFKVNGSKIYKILFSIMVVLLIIIVCIVTFKIFNGANELSNDSCIPKSNTVNITSSNYTNILKTVHDNIDNYIGLKIKFTGYVYRVLDLEDNQFILARDMIISSDRKCVVVGFLCEYDTANELKDNTWIEVTGTIKKGNYHGDMPILKITQINPCEKPNDEFVYPPDETYIPTNEIL